MPIPNPARERFDSVTAVVKAINDVPGLIDLDLLVITEIDERFDWQYGFKTPAHGMIHLYEHDNEVTLLRRGESGRMEKVFVSQNPDVRTLSTVLVRNLIGQPSIPPRSRKVVREVLHAAEVDAAYHFREGMHHILTHRDWEGEWSILDDSDRWETIHGAFIAATNRDPKTSGFLPSFRRYGVPMGIMDIYEDRYIETAMTLLGSITSAREERFS